MFVELYVNVTGRPAVTAEMEDEKNKLGD